MLKLHSSLDEEITSGWAEQAGRVRQYMHMGEPQVGLFVWFSMLFDVMTCDCDRWAFATLWANLKTIDISYVL
jgi:hypothetical protein